MEVEEEMVVLRIRGIHMVEMVYIEYLVRGLGVGIGGLSGPGPVLEWFPFWQGRGRVRRGGSSVNRF